MLFGSIIAGPALAFLFHIFMLFCFDADKNGLYECKNSWMMNIMGFPFISEFIGTLLI